MNSAGEHMMDAVTPVGSLMEDKKKRILVVEDDATHRSLMSKILEQCECDVVMAENGLEALSFLNGRCIFDLIIMDWDMPELNGLDTVRIIRRRQAERKIPYIPVIAFTAKREPGDRAKCMAAGMDGYLTKDIWMPRWRQSLIDILQGLISGNFDVKDFDEEPKGTKSVGKNYDLEMFDHYALNQAASILKEEFAIAVDEYLSDAASYIRAIRKGLEDEDFRAMEKASHPLKSNSKSFGLTSVSEVAESINIITRDAVKTKAKLLSLMPLVPMLEEAFKTAEGRLRMAVKEKAQI